MDKQTRKIFIIYILHELKTFYWIFIDSIFRFFSFSFFAVNFESYPVDNRSNQLNPNNTGTGAGRPAGFQGDNYPAALDNHANNLNPNHPNYDKSRGK